MKILITLILQSVTIITFSQEAVCSFVLPDSILFEDIKDIKMINDVNQIPGIKILDTLQNSFGTVILFVADNYENHYIAMKKEAAWEYFNIPYARGIEILRNGSEEYVIRKRDDQLFLTSLHKTGNSSAYRFGYSGSSGEEENLLIYDLTTRKKLLDITTKFRSQSWFSHYEDKEGKIVDAPYMEKLGFPEDADLDSLFTSIKDSLFTSVSGSESEYYSCQYSFEKNHLKLECECSSYINGIDNAIISKVTKNYLLKSDKFISQKIDEKKER